MREYNGGIFRASLTVLGLAILTNLLVSTTSYALSQEIYFIDGSGQQIRRVTTNGTSNTLLVQLATGAFNGINGGANAQHIAVDPQAGIYWTDLWHDRIRHTNLDGSNLSDVILTGNGEFIHIDPIAGKIYWTEWPQGGSLTQRTLRRSDLNGANPEIVVANSGLPLHTSTSLDASFAIDYYTQKIYYLDNGAIHRMNYDGTGDSVFLAAPAGGIGEIEVDAQNQALFYVPTATGIGVDPSVEQVYKLSLAYASSPQLIYDFNIVFNNRAVLGIGLDYNHTRAYMVDNLDFKIGSVNYDGTSLSGPGSFVGLKAFDLLVIPEPTTIFLSVTALVLFLRRYPDRG